ncbi:hypothetical protein DYB35_012681 [Aphanomyces astaci]|uniref:Uncharacterized protein n=1 Tax=Aphanomyces astaci TaxID=112090 RepID=A0A3R7BTH2_APHAT|nr:hypothetical protein DYB35_012681 [Aphanomyces astaci]
MSDKRPLACLLSDTDANCCCASGCPRGCGCPSRLWVRKDAQGPFIQRQDQGADAQVHGLVRGIAPRWYQRAPLSACIEPISVERTAYWEIGKASHELTEEDWKVFFLGAKECDPVDMSRLDAAMSKLKMDTTVQSAESRVSKLVSDFEVVLVRLSMVRFAEAEPKLTVDYLDAAVQPPAVRAHVKELMKLNENRGLKKDARDFKRWLADYMRRYGEFEPLKAAAVPATAKSDKLPAATKTPKAGKVPKVVAVLNVD